MARAIDSAVHHSLIKAPEQIRQRLTTTYKDILVDLIDPVFRFQQSRQRGRVISYALSRRMGLTPASHRSSLTLEVASILAVSFVLGAVLAVAAAKLVLGDIDTLANVPPAPLLRVPTSIIAWAAVALVAASLVGGSLAHRAAARGRIAEVIRLGD